MSASLRLIFGLSFNVFGGLALDLPFGGGTFKLGKYYYTIFLSSMILFKGFEHSISIYRNLTELCTTPAWAVGCVVSPALDVIRAQLQRLQEWRKIRTYCKMLLELFRLDHSHELWSKNGNLNLDLNSVSETDITLAILKANKQTNKNHSLFTFEQSTNNCNLTVKQCHTIRLLLTELIPKTELQF